MSGKTKAQLLAEIERLNEEISDLHQAELSRKEYDRNIRRREDQLERKLKNKSQALETAMETIKRVDIRFLAVRDFALEALAMLGATTVENGEPVEPRGPLACVRCAHLADQFRGLHGTVSAYIAERLRQVGALDEQECRVLTDRIRDYVGVTLQTGPDNG